MCSSIVLSYPGKMMLVRRCAKSELRVTHVRHIADILDGRQQRFATRRELCAPSRPRSHS